MESLLTTHFKRVEVALASLIDSIARYNPNPIHASDLVAANAELGQGLEKLTNHQLNFARILSLRKTSKELDNQIRDTLEHLASIRKQIISTPVSSPVYNINSVSYTELLDYARRISKFTSPPSYHDPIINNDVTEPTISKTSNGTPNTVRDDDKPNTHLRTTNGQQHSPVKDKIDGTIVPAEAAATSQTTIMINNNNWFDYLNPRSDKPWTPWPSEEVIRRGALASIQVLINQGIDPATFDPEKSAELEAERKRIMDEEDQEREKQRHQLEVERNLHIRRQASAATYDNIPDGKESQPLKTKVFELETFDDDDDNDDEES